MERDQAEKVAQDKRLRQKITKDSNNQIIDGVTYHYSILGKKSNSGIFTNDRVFFLIENNCIAHANQIPKATLIPFQQKSNLPPFKTKIQLDRVIKAQSTQDTLVIKYKNGGKEQEWKWISPNVNCSKNWEKRINKAIQKLKDERQNPPKDIQVKEEEPKIVQPSKQQKKQEPIVEPKKQVQKPTQPVQNKVQQKKQEEKKGPQMIKDVEEQKKQEVIEKKEQNVEQKPEQKKEEVNPFAALLGKPKQSSPPPKKVSKPVSTFYIGSVSVENEKDQKQLKSKIDTFDVMGSKIKQEYTKKKKQESKLKEQTSMEEGFLGGIFKVSLDTKLQIQKLKKQWGYEFAKGVNEYEVIQDFKQYVQVVVRKIIDELGLQERKRYYQPASTSSDTLKYEIHGVYFDVFLSQLKQVATFEERGTVVSNEAAKVALQQFKNYDYLLRLTRNKGKLRVPLAMITEYKGFTILAKAMIPATQNYENMNLLQKQLQIIQIQSRVNNNSFFEDPQNGRIVPLQAKAYQKLSRAQNLNRKFDICYADSLKCYLPHDFNNFSKEKPYEKLRWELVQDDECENRVLSGDDMCSVSNRLKLPQHLKEGIAELTEISKTIIERVALLAIQLQTLNETFTNSKQLSKLMHRAGINMRYLGVLLQKVKQSWLKQIIMSQICARSAKNFLKFDLQDCLLNLSETNSDNIYKFQVKQVISFLNKIFGSSQDADTFWKQLNRQSQTYFKVSVNRQQINQGFLLQSLQHHCRIKLHNLDQQFIAFFESPAPFTSNNFASFEKYSKVYDLAFTEHYSSVQNLLNEETAEAYDQIKLLLNLTRHNNIPSHFRLSDLYDELIMFLVKWLPPAEARDVYYPQQIQFGEILPSKTLYEIKLTQIKWGLKNGHIEDSDNVKEWVVDHISKWVGDAHPVLTELYEIYARFYMLSKNEEKKTVNYCKSAIKNQQKLLGNLHQKLADNYYYLGSVYLNYGKKAQAINTLKKAKDIISKSSNEESQAFGEVCLKMGQLYLAINSPKQAIQLGLKAFDKLSDCGDDLSTVQAIQLVCRCFEITQDWDSYMTLIQQSLVQKIPEFSDEVELVERILKVTILPSLKIIASTNSSVTQKLLKLLSELPETTRAPNMAYNFLRQRIEERVFPQQFLQTLNDIQDVLDEIERNGMIARWKGFESLTNKSLLQKVGGSVNNRGFNLIANLQALNIFIGGSFIEGVLSEQ